MLWLLNMCYTTLLFCSVQEVLFGSFKKKGKEAGGREERQGKEGWGRMQAGKKEGAVCPFS